MEPADIGLSVMFLIWAGLLTMPYWIKWFKTEYEKQTQE